MNVDLADAVTAVTGDAVVAMNAVAGGDVSSAFRTWLASGREIFVKYRSGAPAEMFRAEADGLDWLRAATDLRVPAVLGVGAGAVPFLALEWIPPGARGAGHDERLGRGIAAMHRAGAATFGLERGNYIATIAQDNTPEATWPAFYGQRRLAPAVRTLRDAGVLDASTAARFDGLMARLDDLCGPPEPPARLHGDLWGGNAIADSEGAPVLIDPAVYGGHREVDLAMMRLFGGFGPAVFDAYAEVHPPAPGHADRVALYQLWPLLVHALLFGSGYVGRLTTALRRYA